jgi:hypothetical protein
MILATKDVRDAHVRIVDRIAKEKCSGPVGTSDDEVANVIGQETLRPVDKVRELDATAERNTESSRW